MSGMLRDVVYHSMLFAQRRRLHRAAALALGTYLGTVFLLFGFPQMQTEVWKGTCAPLTPIFAPVVCFHMTRELGHEFSFGDVRVPV
jgi:hypothetical protein